MSPLSCEILVVGAGILGLSVAAELTARAHEVRVVDPGRLNASAVAAGMIAPAFESLLDGADAERAGLLRDAALLWPAFAERQGLDLDPTPAEWRGSDAAEVAQALAALGFSVEREGDVVRAGCDLKIEPETALARLRDRLAHPVLAAEAERIEPAQDGWRVATSSGVVAAKALVLATGTAAALPGLSDALVDLINGIEPIAGQIGRSDLPLTDRVCRGAGGYVAPSRGGAVIGATMVHGGRETTPDPGASVRLIAVAARLTGRVSGAVEWRGGVRGATADGLPLAGAVGGSLYLALAPRRNGWLLGPLVGRVVADAIDGRPRGSHAAALDPLRFSPGVV